MSSASSAAVATPLTMVRILLFICWGQLMVTTGNTVEAKDFEDNLNMQERHINAGYNRYPNLGWKSSDPGCDFLDTSHTVDSEQDCLIECTANEECTAVNYKENNGFCRLIKCELPVQEPTASASGYVGYSVKQGDCQHFFNGVIFHDKCLYLSEDSDTKTWQEAKDECSRKHGELAMFSDDPHTVLNLLEESGKKSLIYWVGGSDRSIESRWEWNNGVSIPLDPFEFPWGGPEEPNGEGDENCLDVRWFEFDNGYRYNDYNCLDELQYICEIGCPFHGVIYPPGTFIQKSCAQLQCDGTTGKFNPLGYDDQCSRCLAYWDPHILNYDHSKDTYCNLNDPGISSHNCGSYAFYKCGNYSLTQIGSSVKPSFAVYSTFERCGGSSYATCVDTVTFKNDENTIITIAYDTNEDKLKIQVNGNDVKAAVLSTSPSIVQDTSDVVYPVIAWTSVYYNAGHDTTCVSLQGSSGILVRYCGDSFNKASTVLVWASHEIAINELRGLCGTANDNKADDFTARDGITTWPYYNPAPDDFPLSWLVSGASDVNCGSGRKDSIIAENKCEANSTLQDNFQSQCKDSVNLGFSDGGIDLSQILIDDCVHDLCIVTDPNKWMGSVHGALPVHAEIKEKTAGHCHHKRNHKCKTHSGTCIMKSETCDGTIIERGCHGKKCICCAPNPCDQTSKCLAKQGKCILRKDWAGCDGNVNTELCSGPDCACCYPKAPKKVKERKQCLKMNGKCMQKDNWGNCGGILKIRWCKGKKWACCYTK